MPVKSFRRKFRNNKKSGQKTTFFCGLYRKRTHSNWFPIVKMFDSRVNDQTNKSGGFDRHLHDTRNMLHEQISLIQGQCRGYTNHAEKEHNETAKFE